MEGIGILGIVLIVLFGAVVGVLIGLVQYFETMADEERTQSVITFQYAGAFYTTGLNAQKYNQVVLPSRKVIRILGWSESYPPRPFGLVEIIYEDLFLGLSVNQIADKVGASVAKVKV